MGQGVPDGASQAVSSGVSRGPGHHPPLLRFAVVQLLRCVRLSTTPWTAACPSPLSMGSPRQEHWRGVALPSSRGTSPTRGSDLGLLR